MIKFPPTEYEKQLSRLQFLPDKTAFDELTGDCLDLSFQGIREEMTILKAFHLWFGEENNVSPNLVSVAIEEAYSLVEGTDEYLDKNWIDPKGYLFYKQIFAENMYDGLILDRDHRLGATTETKFASSYLLSNPKFWATPIPLVELPLRNRGRVYGEAYLDTMRLISFEAAPADFLERAIEFSYAYHHSYSASSKIEISTSNYLAKKWFDDNFINELFYAYTSIADPAVFTLLLEFGLWGRETWNEYKDLPIEWLRQITKEKNG